MATRHWRNIRSQNPRGQRRAAPRRHGHPRRSASGDHPAPSAGLAWSRQRRLYVGPPSRGTSLRDLHGRRANPPRQDFTPMRSMIHTVRPFSAAALLAALATPAALVAQQIITPRPAAPQQADQNGRTLLPMKIARSISFRQIGPAVSGGRVAAVAGVPGQNDTYYVGTADGGVFRTTN